jgi:hypothetical protein
MKKIIKSFKEDTEDELDELFIETFNEKSGQWQWKPIKGIFCNWLNSWGDVEVHLKYMDWSSEDERRSFKKGYEKAIDDVFKKLKINFKSFDKRTKTGFKK